LINPVTISQEDFNALASYHLDLGLNLRWDLVFTLPAWLKVWWQNFGTGADLFIRSVRYDGKIIGIAPLQIRNHVASIIGSVDVCDYQDFILVPGRERDFFNAILDDLDHNGIRELHLETVRPDSAVAIHLIPLAQERKYKVDYHQSDVSADLDLPASWDEYLALLDGKQRHEIKRKMRNLSDLGETSFRAIEKKEEIPAAVDSFLKLFPESRGDKAQFMTGPMQIFFRSLTETLAEIGIARFAALELSGKPLAMVLYFDYNDNVYLYNSAYDPAYKSMSVGIISKTMCIQDNIAKKKRKFDFLKGSEQYKYYLGGKEIKLYSCHISLG
jgi:CelD/BcsL family acetyltransferase involved in cellulose biosynthesis